MNSRPLLIAVMGPTATGKTALAERLAETYEAKLINADTFQCYRYLNIGTAKPEMPENYALIDIIEPTELLGVGAWVQLADTELDRRRNVVMVGGSGLNVRALLEGYGEMHSPPPPGLRDQLNSMSLPDLVAKLRDLAPEVATRIDLNNPVRVTRAIERLNSTKSELAFIDLSAYQIVKIGLDASQAWLSRRIEQRTKEMLGLGWLQEVAHIRDLGFKFTDPGLKAHGYRTLWKVLEGTKDIEQAEQEITIMVRQYAKRQRTWLRAEPKLCKIWAEDGQRSVEDAYQCISKVGAHG